VLVEETDSGWNWIEMPVRLKVTGSGRSALSVTWFCQVVRLSSLLEYLLLSVNLPSLYHIIFMIKNEELLGFIAFWSMVSLSWELVLYHVLWMIFWPGRDQITSSSLMWNRELGWSNLWFFAYRLVCVYPFPGLALALGDLENCWRYIFFLRCLIRRRPQFELA
jgi:hypothetical protein